MRLRLRSTFVALALWSSVSHAQGYLDLTWNDCVLESHVQDLNFTNCDTSLQTYKLYLSFKVHQAVPNFFAADLVFDLEDQTGSSIGPFWRFDPTSSGGCNSAGLTIHIDAQLEGRCSGEVNPWTSNQSSALANLTGYLAGYNSPCRARFFASIARDSQDPFPLESDVNYYMCHLALNTSQRASCSGCADKVAIVWNSATLYENTGNAVTIAGADKLGNCITANRAESPCVSDRCAPFNPPCPQFCAPVAVAKWSWGRLKTIYR